MANLLEKTRSWKKKAILARLETMPGEDAQPTAADWIEARNVNLTPFDAETADRNLEKPFFGNSGKALVGQYAKLSFEVALAGAGAPGAAPKFADLLLACAMAQTQQAGVSTVFNLVSENIPSISFYINVDGTKMMMVGSRGTFSFSIGAKAIPLFKFEFQSAYLAPVGEAMPSVNMSGWPVEEAVTARNTAPLILGGTGGVGGIALAYSQLDIDIANQLARINLPGPQAEVIITDRQSTGSLVVLAPEHAAFDPFAIAEAGVVQELSTTHGSAAGKRVQVDAKVRVIGVEFTDLEGALAYKLNIEPAPVAGNDELALTWL
ncbi:MAG: hypothetical protein FWD77_04520 [Betaproteobacteria bacterium]|nr:hypothetical protein [Betaproteobacteria bacterium]